MDPQGQQLDTSKLTPTDRRDLQHLIQNESQKTNIQTTVHRLTDICWKKCVTGKVSSGSLDRSEETCAQNCVERWMDSSLSVLKQLETMRGQ